MSHWHLQIQFGFDFEGYAAGFHTEPPPQHTHRLLPPFITLVCSYLPSFKLFFLFYSLSRFRGGDATLSAATPGRTPRVGFNGCGTVGLRHRDLAGLFPLWKHYANVLGDARPAAAVCGRARDSAR